jgi:hypothetical protein
MDRYDELIKSLETYKDITDECGHSLFIQTVEAIEALQTAVGEKQKLLDEALEDLSSVKECKYCSNIEQCSMHRIERNLAYGGCDKWQWHGTDAAVKAS